MKLNWGLISLLILVAMIPSNFDVSATHSLDLTTATSVGVGEFSGMITDERPYLIFNFSAVVDHTYSFQIGISEGHILLYDLFDSQLNHINRGDTSQYAPVLATGENKYIIVLNIDSRFSSEYILTIDDVTSVEGLTRTNPIELELGKETTIHIQPTPELFVKVFTTPTSSYQVEELSEGKKHSIEVYADGRYLWDDSVLYDPFVIAGFGDYALLKILDIDSADPIILTVTDLHMRLNHSIVSDAFQLKEGEQRFDLIQSNIPQYVNFTGTPGHLYSVNVYPIDNPTLFATRIQILHTNGTPSHFVRANLQYKQIFGLIGGTPTTLRFFSGSAGGFRIEIERITDIDGRTYDNAINYSQSLILGEVYANMPLFVNISTDVGQDYLITLTKLFVSHIDVYESRDHYFQISNLQTYNTSFSRQFWHRAETPWIVLKFEPVFYLEEFTLDVSTIELTAPSSAYAENIDPNTEIVGQIVHPGTMHWYRITTNSSTLHQLIFLPNDVSGFQLTSYDINLDQLNHWEVRDSEDTSILIQNHIQYFAVSGPVGPYSFEISPVNDTQGLLRSDPIQIQLDQISSIRSKYDLGTLFYTYTPEQSGWYVMTLGTGNQRLISIQESTRPNSVPITTMNSVYLNAEVAYIFNFETVQNREFEVLLRGPFSPAVTGHYSGLLDKEDRFGWRVSLTHNEGPMLSGGETLAGADTMSIELTETVVELPITNSFSSFDMNINGNPISRIRSDFFELPPSMLILPTAIELQDGSQIDMAEAINRQIFSYSKYLSVADTTSFNDIVTISYTTDKEDITIEYDAEIGVLSSFHGTFVDQFGNEIELELELRAIGIDINTESKATKSEVVSSDEDTLFTVPFPVLPSILFLLLIPVLKRREN